MSFSPTSVGNTFEGAADSGTQSWRAKTNVGSASRQSDLLHLAIVIVTFLALYFLTVPTEGADTLRYAADAVKHAFGVQSQFWEFGHLLWRPWGFLGYSVLGQTFKAHFHDADLQAASRFLIITNFVGSLGAVLVLWDLIRRLTSNTVATFVAIAFSGANGFLENICLGSAYMPAIFFQISALWLLARATYQERHRTQLSTLAGFSFAIATLLWFPFSISGLGVALFPLLWIPETVSWRDRGRFLVRLLAPFLAVLILTDALAFSIAALHNGIHDVHGFLQWVTDANNGWSQNLNLVRATTGFARTMFELTDEGVALKRWFFHDPYHHVSLLSLASSAGLKLGLFYAGIVSFLLLIPKTASPRRLFLVLGAAILPLLFFAIVLFEATSTGRYLPAFAFLFTGFAIVFHQISRRSPLYWILAVMLVSAFISNFVRLGWAMPEQTAEMRRQKTILEASLSKPAIVFVTTLHEMFYVIPLSRPLDHSLASNRYAYTDLVEPASTRIPHWRGEFAQATLAGWRDGKEIWVPAAVFQNTPTRASTWVEGDDRRISWNAIHAFFTGIVTDKASGGPDGFVRVAMGGPNEQRLTQVAEQDSPPVRLLH